MCTLGVENPAIQNSPSFSSKNKEMKAIVGSM